MRIGFLSIDHLRDWTGITRLIDRIAADMAKRGHEVFLLAHENKAAESIPVGQCEYPHTLVTFALDTPANILSARERIAGCGLDVCMTSMGNTDLLYMPRLFYGTRTPYIIGEAANPRVFIYERWQPYEHFAALNGAAAIQILLEEYRPYYPKTLKPRITTIGNPAPPIAEVDFIAIRSKEIRYIVAVGRFNEADKRFSVLLRAFALLCKDFPDRGTGSVWRLKLVGDGPYWEYYHEMAKQLGIKQLVEFTGAVPDPAEHYNQPLTRTEAL
jgi:glycosyltransferase involved in cell wall biosynthesis